jgi:hypothetical protein
MHMVKLVAVVEQLGVRSLQRESCVVLHGRRLRTWAIQPVSHLGVRMMRYVRWKALTLGALTFVLGHFIEVAKWRSWFEGGEHAAWFLNDGNRAVLFMMGCLFVASLFASVLWARDKGDAFVHGGNVAAGAVIAMTVLIFAAPWGPGNLFPIAIAIGGFMLLLSTFAAALIVAATKRG